MLTTIPEWVQVGLEVIGSIAGLAALLGLVAGAVFIVRRSKITGEDQLAQSAVTSLTGELAAQKSQNERDRDEIAHLRELLTQQREITTQLEQKTQAQGERISELTQLITGSDKIDNLTDLTKAAFQNLGVPGHLLGLDKSA